jgi:cell wall-associated NlpC family hydrolase
VALPALVGVFVLAGSAGATPSVSAKRAEAQQAMAQIDQMDQQLEAVGNKWQGAKYKLGLTTKKLNSTRVSLGLARKSFSAARHALAKRVIAAYMEQDDTSGSTVAIMFQATSLQDMINRVEARQRISDYDSRITKQTKTLRNRTASQAASLEKLQAKQQAYANEISSQWNELKRKQNERRAYVRSVRREIASLIAEQERQARESAAVARQAISQSNVTAAAPSAPIANVPSSTIGGIAVNAAMTKIGRPYSWGAAGPDAFDCSGLVVWAFAQAGRSLPHYSYSLMSSGTPVSTSALEPGDLVFFYGGGHVGIYVGGGQFIHAPHTGSYVQVNSLSSHGGLTAAVRIS